MTPCVDKGRAPVDISSYQPPQPAASCLRTVADFFFFLQRASQINVLFLFSTGGSSAAAVHHANINVKGNNSTLLEPRRARKGSVG